MADQPVSESSQLRRIGRAVAFLLVIVLVSLIVGCGGPSFTERFREIPDGSTSEEVVSVLGPGEKVKNPHTDALIAVHKLPADTVFLRWQDPDDPTVLHHMGFSDGKMVDRNTHHDE